MQQPPMGPQMFAMFSKFTGAPPPSAKSALHCICSAGTSCDEVPRHVSASPTAVGTQYWIGYGGSWTTTGPSVGPLWPPPEEVYCVQGPMGSDEGLPAKSFSGDWPAGASANTIHPSP